MVKLNRARFPDSQGIYFDEAVVRGAFLPNRVSDWDRIRRVTDAVVLSRFHNAFSHGTCWLCSTIRQHAAQAHHIASGARKSDELTNLVIVGGAFDCNCHNRVQSSPAALREVFFAKWKHDHPNLSWVRLIHLVGRWPTFDKLEG